MLTDPIARYMSKFLRRAPASAWMAAACGISYDANEQLLLWMIQHPKCEKAVALAIYWYLAPRWDAQYPDKSSISASYECARFDMLREIERRFSKDSYVRGQLGFNPAQDYFADERGYDWTECYQDKPLARPIPEMMKKAIPGISVSRTDPAFSEWEEGMPPSVWEKLYSFHKSSFWPKFYAIIEVLRSRMVRGRQGDQ